MQLLELVEKYGYWPVTSSKTTDFYTEIVFPENLRNVEFCFNPLILGIYWTLTVYSLKIVDACIPISVYVDDEYSETYLYILQFAL